jgi:hypothetical protein
MGGRSTHGVCMGVLSWVIEEGVVDGADVAGLPVALALRYSDDEPRSPWTYVLYLDERGTKEQREALESLFTGRLGGDAESHFPWVWKPSNLVAVRRADIAVEHVRTRERLRIRDHVDVQIRDRYQDQGTVTCVIPGHDRSGEELVTERIAVEDEELSFRFEDVCGYASTFEYAG